ELYEPLWEEIHARSKHAGFRIRSIWIADAAHQGQSGVLNEHSLGNDHTANTSNRDGATLRISLSVMHPRLLTTLILLDPVINRLDVLDHEYSKQTKVNIPAMTLASTYRRDLWPSRIAAETALKGSKFYQNWDPRVLQRFFKYGLRELPTALYPLDDDSANKPVGERPVTLTTTRHQEVLSFFRAAYGSKSEDGQTLNRTTHPDLDPNIYKSSFPFYRYEVARTFDMLPFVRPSVLYLFADHSEVSSPKMNQDKIEQTGIAVGGSGGAAEGRVKGIVMKGVGHLIAMEAVNRTAELCTDQISVEIHRWRREEEQLTTAWNKKSSVEKMTIDQEWVKQADLLGIRNTKKKTSTGAKL
ncbi:toxin biosynthesis protein, putative, partial [Trichophyton benhamiae CBS 112371]